MQANRTNTEELATQLLDRRYVDPHDSGDLVMEVWALDALSPATVIYVRPVLYPDRVWWRSAASVWPLVLQYEAQNQQERAR